MGEVKVATHYVNQEDERTIQGVGHDTSKANELYTKMAEGEEEK